MTKNRYCIVSDGDGHKYIVLADYQEAMNDYFEACDKYWNGEEKIEMPPEPPCELRQINIYCLTFTDPEED